MRNHPGARGIPPALGWARPMVAIRNQNPWFHMSSFASQRIYPIPSRHNDSDNAGASFNTPHFGDKQLYLAMEL